MAVVDDEREDENPELTARIEQAIKTNRLLFFIALAVLLMTLSVLVTSAVVTSLQLAKRDRVPAEEFAEQLAALDSQLTHISELHNAEAQAYFAFQDTLAEIHELYHQEEINQLRALMADRERDHRRLLDLMAEGMTSLSRMLPGSRQWAGAYAEQVKQAKAQSEEREAAVREAMEPPPAVDPEAADAETTDEAN